MHRHRIRDYFRPAAYARKVREGGWRRATAWYLGLIVGLVQVALMWLAGLIRRQWDREPTYFEALGLALMALPIGVAGIIWGLGL